MRYNVPQFIDIEDKIFGPLTFKQAIYTAGGVFGAFIIFYSLGKLSTGIPAVIKLAAASPIAGLGLSLAFIKINKRPFIYFMESFFKYIFNAKRYIWRKKEKKSKGKTEVNHQPIKVQEQYMPRVNRTKLKDIAWSLDMDKEDF